MTTPSQRIISAAIAAFVLVCTVATAATVDATYNAATDVPVTASGYTATGNTVNFTLNYAPATGTDLMVVSNTALPFINGTFDNLAQGQPVALSYGGVTYKFVANYYGGSGNDLVLKWASTRAFNWGSCSDGWYSIPAPVPTTSLLAGKTVVAISGGQFHTMELFSDGTVAAWGGRYLGDNTNHTEKSPPVVVSSAPGVSALYDKTVVAIAAGSGGSGSSPIGSDFSLALCSDGTVAAWGGNDYGQLGDNTGTPRSVPVAVNTASGVSALYGKSVVAISGGEWHSLALCSDGTVAAWGYNLFGQLGDNTKTQRNAPVAVNTGTESALYGKTVVAISAGAYFSLALCSDGTLAAWGANGSGQLGDNTTTNRLVPVAVDIGPGSALYSKTVVAIAAGYGHNLALCSEGTIAAWGNNQYGAIGDNTMTNRLVPVTVNTDSGTSALYGKTVVGIAAGFLHSLALCSDGTAAAWGYNRYGQLGDHQVFTNSLVPVAVNTSTLAPEQRFTGIASSPHIFFSLALVAAPPASETILTGAQTLTNGAFQFAFTNTPGAFFGVVAATNPTLPLDNWTSLTGLTEVLPGQFQFTDPQAATNQQRFYRVRSP